VLWQAEDEVLARCVAVKVLTAGGRARRLGDPLPRRGGRGRRDRPAGFARGLRRRGRGARRRAPRRARRDHGRRLRHQRVGRRPDRG
jgi:hypothetical protein